ncbi:MAG: hypothetical protein JXQ73_22585 [Phycisphaerae bacterium]|nr:hypothetical protein [Phycisphaerae bacterium]
MLHRWRRNHKRWALLCMAAMPVLASCGCTLDQWIVPLAAGAGGLLGWQLLGAGAA